jgi:hypothetical protein
LGKGSAELKPAVIIAANIHHARFGKERMVLVLASVVGPTCQSEEKEGTDLGEKRNGPWASFGCGLKLCPGALLCFFVQNLFPFSVLIETFCKNTPIWFKPILNL